MLTKGTATPLSSSKDTDINLSSIFIYECLHCKFFSSCTIFMVQHMREKHNKLIKSFFQRPHLIEIKNLSQAQIEHFKVSIV